MMPAHDPSNLLESLRAQQERATALAERLRVDQARAEELIAPFAPAEEAIATLRTDERGLLIAVAIERRPDATADGVRRAFADAAVTSRLARPTLPLEAIDAMLADPSGEHDTVTVWDDLRQVGVSARFGDIVAVDGSDQWLTTTPANVMAEEILRIAHEAIRRSDRFDRFTTETEGERHHG